MAWGELVGGHWGIAVEGGLNSCCSLFWNKCVYLLHHAANCGGTYSSNGYSATGCPTAGNSGSGSCSSYSCPSGYSGTASGSVTCSDGSYSGSLSGCHGELYMLCCYHIPTLQCHMAVSRWVNAFYFY